MATVVENPSYGQAIGEALGGLGGTLLGTQYGLGVGEQVEEEQYQKKQTRLSELIQKYKNLQDDPEFQNLPLEQKMGLTTLMFGEKIGKTLAEAETLRVKEKEIEGKKKEGEKPALTLNEELNQVSKRYEQRKKNLTLPYEKSDAFGNIFLDFEYEDLLKSKTLAKLDKELKKHAEEVEKLYRRYGQPVPEDIEETLKSEILVDYNGQKVPLTIIDSVKKFIDSHPPKKYKGKSATDEETGVKFRSDGEKWEIVG